MALLQIFAIFTLFATEFGKMVKFGGIANTVAEILWFAESAKR